MMDDIEAHVRQGPGSDGRAPAEPPDGRHQAGSRPGLPARDQLRRAHADQDGRQLRCRHVAAPARRRTPQHRLGRSGGDVRRISPAEWLRYRALWFSLLSQGITRAGTANSDTHSLSLEHAGYPRNIVFGDHQGDAFSVETFDAAVRQGHIVGTNGPVLQAALTDAEGRPLRDENGQLRQPGMEVHGVPREGTQITVSVAAAPWIPLREIRVFVNGTLKVADDLSNIPSIVDVDPFGSVPATMPPRSYKLSDLVPAPAAGENPRDVWVVVEVGMVQDTPPDMDDDGLPDLPELELPGRPASTSDPRFHYQAIVPGGWPVAFTNPFLLDLDGNGGWQDAGTVSLSRVSTQLRLLAGVLTLAAPAATARAANGDACPLSYEAANGPLAGGTGPADFGAIPDACPATEVAMRARGAMLIASTMPDYYGSILTSAMLRGRYRLSERSSLSLAVDALNYRYVNNGGLSAMGASFGPANAGVPPPGLAGREDGELAVRALAATRRYGAAEWGAHRHRARRQLSAPRRHARRVRRRPGGHGGDGHRRRADTRPAEARRPGRGLVFVPAGDRRVCGGQRARRGRPRLAPDQRGPQAGGPFRAAAKVLDRGPGRGSHGGCRPHRLRRQRVPGPGSGAAASTQRVPKPPAMSSAGKAGLAHASTLGLPWVARSIYSAPRPCPRRSSRSPTAARRSASS